jgi:hypothetical protein
VSVYHWKTLGGLDRLVSGKLSNILMYLTMGGRGVDLSA